MGLSIKILESDFLGVTFTCLFCFCFIQTCGHRWKNIYYMRTDNKLPSGVCYAVPSDLRTELSKKMAPCYRSKHGIMSLDGENPLIP